MDSSAAATRKIEIDAIAVYCADLDACYLLPRDLSVDRSAVQLRLAPTLNNQQRLINWAKDYEFGARLPTYGPIAQLGERLHGMQEAGGSSPPGSIV
jgi:PD-(D/E)XK endonuclease